MLKQIFIRILIKLKSKKIIDEVWGFAKKIEVAGCKFNMNDTSEVQLIIDEFTFSLIDTVNRLKNHKENQDKNR